jgi:ABC-type methionine transport system ATPase subunit
MPVEFRKVSCPPVEQIDIVAPDGAVIGLIGEDESGTSTLLRLAAGVEAPRSGSVAVGTKRRLLGPGDALNFAPVDTLLLDHALALHDGLVRARAVMAIDRLRRAGATILLTSHDEKLLEDLTDEIWWLDKGGLVARGNPAEVLHRYRTHIAQRVRAWGESISGPISPSVREGDGRAEILAVETIGEGGKPTTVWRSGESVAVRVSVKFRQTVANPVIGILIRTRTGLNVYGTNTELERLKFGPCSPGDSLRLNFGFRCDLCPQEYTLTTASHDPDGVRHDWLEDAVAFAVTDLRPTAGVANLRAQVSVDRI